MKPITKLLGIASLFVSASIFVDAIKNSANAEITANPNDAGTVINQDGDTLNIEGGTRADKNLFHSFEKFGVEAGQTANFKSNPEIENILGRVTGGDASVINGLIQVTGGNSNLYLMNPAGMIFGSGASLNVPAAFNATTASGIRFEDEGNWFKAFGENDYASEDNWFKAFGENDYASLVGHPDAFAFTQSGTIFNSGDLEVEKGQVLTLSGGTVISTGTLKAPGGYINITAVPEGNLVVITQKGNLLSLIFNKNLPEENKALLNNQSFKPLSLPQLLTGGNLNNATGIEVENGVVKLTGSGTVIPDKPGNIVVSNNINTEGEASSIPSKTGNFTQDRLLDLLGDVVIRIADDDSKLILDGNINSSGDVTIRGNTILGGDITSNGGDIRVEIPDLIKDATISTGENVAGNIVIFDASISNDSAKTYNLNLVAGQGDVRLKTSGNDNENPAILKNLNIDGNNVNLVSSNIVGNLNVKATNDIGLYGLLVNGDANLEAGNNVNVSSFPNSSNIIDNLKIKASNNLLLEDDLTVTGDIYLEARDVVNTYSLVTAGGNTQIIATNKIEIRDTDYTPAIVTTGGDLTIQGNKRINIQAFKNDKSIFKSGNDLTLISDGEIGVTSKFDSNGDFDVRTLQGSNANFSQALTPSTDTIISSEGDVNFGNYDGLSLKIEAKGSITGGDITINGSNPNLTGSDPDIELLTEGPGLVLRAGVNELQNEPNIPDETVGSTSFTSETNPSSRGDIQVGDVNTVFGGPGGSVTMSATGNINTGHIETAGTPYDVNIDATGFVDLQAPNGDIEVKMINTSSGGLSSDINIIAGGTFRATDYILINDWNAKFSAISKYNDANHSGKRVYGEIPTSIHTSTSGRTSTISIQHGGSDFIIGPTFRNANDNSILEENNHQPRLTGVGSPYPAFSEKPFVLERNIVSTLDTTSGSDNITDSTSFTTGAITAKRNDGAGMSSFRDSSLENTTSIGGGYKMHKIDIIFDPPINNDNSNLGSSDNSVSGTNENNFQAPLNEQLTPEESSIPNAEFVQSQLIEKERDEIFYGKNSAVPVNNIINTPKLNSTNNDPYGATNNRNDNILKVIPDYRFDDSSALPADWWTTLINPIPRLLNERGKRRKK
ncbi:MAG: filamentous hemagglutinin N-terminal domain-containing protein [Cyanobacteria bacterium J06573_2]